MANNAMTLRDNLNGDAFRDQLKAVLPRHLTPERMVRVASTALLKVPKLAKCDQASFLSQWGLEPDGRNAHLIPFENRKRGIVECQLILDYKGIVELMMRSGKVANIHADKVCRDDDFVFDCGQIVRHRIDFSQPRGEPYAYYCIITMKDGTKKAEVMAKDEIDKIRKRSMSGNNGPWVTDYDEMAKKTVFKRASKWCQLSAEVADAIVYDDGQYRAATPVQSTGASIVASIAQPDTPEVDWDEKLNKATTVAALEQLAAEVKAHASDDTLPADEVARIQELIDERLAIIAEES
jgi:recombination protein RecT